MDIRWALGEQEPRLVEDLLFGLLAAIEERGALRRAAEAVGVSYRHAWGLLTGWEATLGQPLARLERGRGARLTPLGRTLLEAHGHVARQLAGPLARRAAEAAAELAEALPPRPSAPLRLSASHSLAVERLRELATDEAGRTFVLHTCGSIESLRRLRAGECDLAGFHVPAGSAATRLARHYTRWLNPAEHCLVHVILRRQGMMVAANNPLGIHALEDLTRPGVRFINRQDESGTRLLLDDLLARNNMDIKRIDGYHTEEFTHTAVASMVASGAADVGFGIAAAAERFGLTFLPLAQEHYYFALHRHKMEDTRVTALIALLRSTAFRRQVAAMAGYDTTDAGCLVEVTDALGRKNIRG
ncbi:MAG: substrate-binding domain-containing protein [Leptospirillia bacterium]